MIEIKFRVWDKKFKEMCSVTDIQIWCDHVHYSYEDSGIIGKGNYPIDVEIMQYTGLKDKSGKEIYEGDILHHKWDSGNDIWEEAISEVKFSKGAFVVDDKKRSDWLLSLHALPKWAEIEVIGNIHENPELLTQNLLGQ